MFIRSLKDNKDQEATNKLIEFYGICTTCNDASICKNARNSTNPVWHCEQFDDNTQPVMDKADKDIIHQSNSGINSSPQEIYSGKFKGLCINCDHRETCIHSRTEGGIWHCEEYQ